MSKIQDALLRARDLRPYMRRIISRMEPIPLSACPTMGVTKGWHLVYNPDWLEATPLEEVAHCIAEHEVEHLRRRHHDRCGARDPQLFNMAGDLGINDDVEGPLPQGVLYPKTFGFEDGLLEEDYYEKLLEKAEQQEQQGQGPPCPRCGSGSGGDPFEGEPEGEPTPLEEQEILEGVAADIKEHHSRHPGTLPDELVMWADAVAKRPPARDWRRDLAATVKRRCRDWQRGREDYCWRDLDRRSRPLEPLMPGTVRPEPTVAILVDTSGSMSCEGPEALGVVEAVKLVSPKAALYSCDTAAREVKRRKFIGGGGTDMRVGIEGLQKKADVIVVVTDGETPWPEKEPPAAIVVALVRDSEWSKPPRYAKVVRVDRPK